MGRLVIADQAIVFRSKFELSERPVPSDEEAKPRPDDSVTEWIARMRRGDDEAVARLWGRYFEPMRRLAARRLARLGHPPDSDEDVALSAFNALVERERAGGDEGLRDRNNLWQLLLVITHRKSANVARRQRRDPTVDAGARLEACQQFLAAPESAPSLETFLATCRDRLDGLEPHLQEVALLRLQGWSNEEISSRFERSVKSVERWLARIRSEWEST